MLSHTVIIKRTGCLSSESLGVRKPKTLCLTVYLSSIKKNSRVKGGWWLLQVEESSLHRWVAPRRKRKARQAHQQEWLSPLRVFETIAPWWQHTLPINAFSCPHGCGNAMLSQVSLKLCWMKDGHSLCKWTALLWPQIPYPAPWRDADNTVRDYFLGRQWFQPEEFKEKHGWKMSCSTFMS